MSGVNSTKEVNPTRGRSPLLSLLPPGAYFTRSRVALIVAGLILLGLYMGISHLSRGDTAWWHLDFVAEGNVYWGDDAYRYFIARSAWINPDVYWFNFTLPLAVIGDGILSTLAGGELLVARWLKALLTVASVYFVYKTCMRLGVSRFSSAGSALLLATLPLYFLVSMSFFGESWLSFMMAAAMFSHVSGRLTLTALLVSLMPLMRPEGLFLVVAFSLWALLRRDWLLALLPYAAGAVYLLLILAVGPGLDAYSSWRSEMMKVYEGAQEWYGGPIERFGKIFFLPWLAVAVAGFVWGHARALWPYLAAATAIIGLVVSLVLQKATNFEPRYLASAMPVIAVGFASGLDRMMLVVARLRLKSLVKGVAIALIGMTFCAQLLSVYAFDQVRQYVSEHGELPLEVRQHPLRMETYFKKLPLSEIESYREFSGVVTEMLRQNPSVKTLVVSNFLVFYFLDPKKIPPDVNVVFAVFGRGRLDGIVGPDRSAGYFARPPFFGIFSLAPPVDGGDLLLYLDYFPIKNYPYHWTVGAHDIFLFSGQLLPSSPSKEN